MADDEDIQIEYVFEEPIIDQTDPTFGEFAKILDAFQVSFFSNLNLFNKF